MKIAIAVGVGLVVLSACGTGPIQPSPTPGGKKFDCGYAIEGNGGLAVGTFDVSGDNKEATQLSVSPPYRNKSGYQCDAASRMRLTIAINDGQVHRLQCKLFRDGEQVDEDHAGTFLDMTELNPEVNCRYR